MSAPEKSPGPSRAGQGGDPASSLDPVPIVEAVEQLRSGKAHEGSFQVIYETYFPAVRRFFAKRLDSADLSLDLTQETFIRVHKGVRGYRGECPFGAWLFRIAWNVLRRHLATRSVSELYDKSISIDDENQAFPDSSLSSHSSSSPEEEGAFASTLRAERRQILRQAIAALPERRRRCMVLWAYDELSYEQIATVMRLSVGTVKAHLAQARQQVAQRVASEDSQL